MKINKYKFLGAMLFFTLLMDVVPFFGFANVGSISITNLHIPGILTAIVLGPAYGGFIGGVFGVISLVRAVSRESTILDLLLQNPFVSVLPRILFPMAAGQLYRFLSESLRGRLESLSISLSCAVGSALNSILVLLALYLVDREELMGIFNVSDQAHIIPSLVHAFLPNMLVEAAACIAVCLLVISGLRELSKASMEI